MSAEIGYLLDRMIRQARDPGAQRDRLVTEAAWWATAHEHPLLEAVRRGFLVRQLCLRSADSDGTWRNSLSYIGDPEPADKTVCTYDYDRAEVRFGPSSPLARPYAWASGGADDEPEGQGGKVEAWYARTGMSAITAWLVTVARIASERGRRHLVLTNRLYHETGVLFDMARLELVEIRRYDDCDALLDATASAADPAVVFLDSSRPDGDAGTLSRVLREVDPGRVGCVVWDNTCAPAAASPFGAAISVQDLRSALLLIRSHAKLDQLGLEFCALGSIAMLSPAAATAEAAAWREGMQRFIPDGLAVTGGCASPATLRLLAALGLPNPGLSVPANQRLREANILGGKLLAEGLGPAERYRVERNEHQCFVEVHILELPAPSEVGGPTEWPAWDVLDRELTALEQSAAQDSIPVWKSASFGFHYTGLSWYAAEDPPRPQGHPHTVLRVCFGMHDPAITARVAGLVEERLMSKQAWTESH
jgi:hypothetical protein